MTKTKIKKAIAKVALTTLIATSFTGVFAIEDIGDGFIDTTKTTDIMWNETFTANSASGSISGVIVKARIRPTINMVVSTGTIDLGTLIADTTSTGSLGIEIGTNAANGVVITARSGSGGLVNTSDDSIKINNSSADGVQDSYTFSSVAGTHDSSYAAFSSTGDLSPVEIEDSTERVIYTTNKPEQNDGGDSDVDFFVAATSNAQTAAGEYEDNITFTVTGNF